MTFPISGVEVQFWVPIAVAFGISTITSMGGISGAFLLLPFQVSILGFTSPAVTPTNLIFNIMAIPGGVYRHAKERRMIWPLLWVLAGGSVAGMLIGVIIRVRYLPDPKNFRAFVGLVLGYMAYRLFKDIIRRKNGTKSEVSSKAPQNNSAITAKFHPAKISFGFMEQIFAVPTLPLFVLSFIVGIIGGIYGIGGGALIAPALVVIFGLPIYAIAGITLFSTFVTSIIGVVFYVIIAPYCAPSGMAVTPDWMLGGLFGIGGFPGIYLGSRLQKFVPAIYIKIILATAIIFISMKYIIGFII